MLRTLAPHLAVAALIVAVPSVWYGLGGPLWIIYPAIVLALLVVLPAYNRWDEQHYQTRR